jgi:hypothetical protein
VSTEVFVFGDRWTVDGACKVAGTRNGLAKVCAGLFVNRNANGLVVGVIADAPFGHRAIQVLG